MPLPYPETELADGRVILETPKILLVSVQNKVNTPATNINRTTLQVLPKIQTPLIDIEIELASASVLFERNNILRDQD